MATKTACLFLKLAGARPESMTAPAKTSISSTVASWIPLSPTFMSEDLVGAAIGGFSPVGVV
jgi:hypothetical protein